ncbi:MAG: glycoside hydrolase family 43 protein [Clostridiales bacterium]|nr:glycoside hydrolase family 43 protein [Clostridiales bacterium]
MLIKTDVTDIGDPFVLYDGGKYYMYATSSPEGFFVWESDNLTDWTKRGFCYKMSDASFGRADFWAPEVVKKDGVYIMHYTAKSKALNSLRIGVARSLSPLGPFTDVTAGEPMFDFGYAVIDATVFTDTDGSPWLYYVRDCSQNVIDGVHTSQIYAVRLDSSLTRPVGNPAFICTPTQGWEVGTRPGWQWNEAPFVIKHAGKYFLTYSGNCFDDPRYGIGLATAATPLGPFVKSSKNPILSQAQGDFSGPGHHCFFRDRSGALMAAFHIHTDPAAPSGNRRLCLCPVTLTPSDIIFNL